MRFRVLAMLEIDCRAILRRTALSERLDTTFCFAVRDGEMKEHCSVCSSGSMTSQGGKCGKREKKCSIWRGRKRRGEVKKRRGRGAESEWHDGGTARFGCNSCEWRCHGQDRARLLLSLVRARGAGIHLERVRAHRWPLWRRDERATCRGFLSS